MYYTEFERYANVKQCIPITVYTDVFTNTHMQAHTPLTNLKIVLHFKIVMKLLSKFAYHPLHIVHIAKAYSSHSPMHTR